MVKRWLKALWSIEAQIRGWIRVSTLLSRHVPVLGKSLGMILDRLLLVVYGIDLTSSSIAVKVLSISHPGGVLLGGNGVVSNGRVAIMSGVKLVGRSPTDAEYLRLHRERRVFSFGDNVAIGANTVVIGPVEICDNVVVGAMSLVNKSITEPGVYVGIPVRKVGPAPGDEWVAHL